MTGVYRTTYIAHPINKGFQPAVAGRKAHLLSFRREGAQDLKKINTILSHFHNEIVEKLAFERLMENVQMQGFRYPEE